MVLAGKDPHHSLRRLSESVKRIQVTGSVLDLRQYIQNSTISIIPMTYGAGLQNKVLEAMACGVPVIASDVAVSAISAVDGQDFLQARSIQEYADKAVYLLDRPAERQRLASNARKYVEENHDWTIIVDQLVGTYMDANGYTRH